MNNELAATEFLEKIGEFSQRIMEPNGMLFVTAMSGNDEVKKAMDLFLRLSSDMDDFYNENQIQ